MNKIRTVCGQPVSLEPVLDLTNMYETTYSRTVRLYDQGYSAGNLPVSRVTLFQGRIATLRLALRRVDSDGLEQGVDLTGIVANVRFTGIPIYSNIGDTRTPIIKSLTIESPSTAGYCYCSILANTFPANGDYTGEVVFGATPSFATFSRFSVLVVVPDI
jgi:hypothetical protein